MFIVNVLAWLTIIGLPIYGIYGGSGSLLFTGIIIAVAGLLLQLLEPVFAGIFNGNASAAGLCQLVLFLGNCIAAFPLGARINRLFQITVEPFDFALGFVFAAVTAIFSVHFSLSFLLGAYADSAALGALQQTSAVRQFVDFDGWHRMSSYILDIGANKATPAIPE